MTRSSLLTALLVTSFATPALALNPAKATPEQKAVAAALKARIGQPGNMLSGIYKSSVRAKQIKVVGSLRGPRGEDVGPKLTFKVQGLKMRDPVGGLKTFHLVDLSGTYLSESFAGPLLSITKLKAEQAPIEALSAK
jgi:hypothetical protein